MIFAPHMHSNFPQSKRVLHVSIHTQFWYARDWQLKWLPLNFRITDIFSEQWEMCDVCDTKLLLVWFSLKQKGKYTCSYWKHCLFVSTIRANSLNYLCRLGKGANIQNLCWMLLFTLQSFYSLWKNIMVPTWRLWQKVNSCAAS